jgi:hypothetical protein
VQFLGSVASAMNKYIWKVWALPKVKFFAWLANQNRIWTANRLEKRGWPNCGLIRKRYITYSSIANTPFTFGAACRNGWASLSLFLRDGRVSQLWNGGTCCGVRLFQTAKAMASITLLVSWEI